MEQDLLVVGEGMVAGMLELSCAFLFFSVLLNIKVWMVLEMIRQNLLAFQYLKGAYRKVDKDFWQGNRTRGNDLN